MSHVAPPLSSEQRSQLSRAVIAARVNGQARDLAHVLADGDVAGRGPDGFPA